LRIAKEEVPRDAQGRALLWVGRNKLTGRGEGASGLKFDVVKPWLLCNWM